MPCWAISPQLQHCGHRRKPSGSSAKSSSVTRTGGLHPLLALLVSHQHSTSSLLPAAWEGLVSSLDIGKGSWLGTRTHSPGSGHGRSLTELKECLDDTLGHRVGFYGCPVQGRNATQRSSWVPSNSGYADSVRGSEGTSLPRQGVTGKDLEHGQNM